MAIKYHDKTDEELVILILEDQEHLVFLIKRYEPLLMRYIRRISNFSQEDIEDVLQEVFVKVYQHLNAFDPKLKFSSWIYRITHNQVISVYRKNKARPQIINWEINDDIVNNLKADFDLNQQLDNAILNETILQILKKLDFKYAQVLALKFLENKSYQEISDIMQKPQGTIATLINRGKEQFKKEFENRN